MLEDSPDRRRAQRYAVDLRVELSEGRGTTRDVSLSGVFFETDRPLAPGPPLRFALFLEHGYPDAPVRLVCEGEIVRIEPCGDRVGIAAAITSQRVEPHALSGTEGTSSGDEVCQEQGDRA